MEYQDDETRHPWEQGGDLPWASGDETNGWLPPDPEAWRDAAAAALPTWPELVSGADAWQPKDLDDEE